MKKLFIGAMLILGTTAIANAKAIGVTTSCGTSYSVDCPSCSTADLVNIALALDAMDCG